MKDKLKTETPNQPTHSAFRFSRMLADAASTHHDTKHKTFFEIIFFEALAK